jgi:hypothetical protein
MKSVDYSRMPLRANIGEPLHNIEDIFQRMREGLIEGRIVVDYRMAKRTDAKKAVEPGVLVSV